MSMHNTVMHEHYAYQYVLCVYLICISCVHMALVKDSLYWVTLCILLSWNSERLITAHDLTHLQSVHRRKVMQRRHLSASCVVLTSSLRHLSAVAAAAVLTLGDSGTFQLAVCHIQTAYGRIFSYKLWHWPLTFSCLGWRGCFRIVVSLVAVSLFSEHTDHQIKLSPFMTYFQL